MDLKIMRTVFVIFYNFYFCQSRTSLPHNPKWNGVPFPPHSQMSYPNVAMFPVRNHLSSTGKNQYPLRVNRNKIISLNSVHPKIQVTIRPKFPYLPTDSQRRSKPLKVAKVSNTRLPVIPTKTTPKLTWRDVGQMKNLQPKHSTISKTRKDKAKGAMKFSSNSHRLTHQHKLPSFTKSDNSIHTYFPSSQHVIQHFSQNNPHAYGSYLTPPRVRSPNFGVIGPNLSSNFAHNTYQHGSVGSLLNNLSHYPYHPSPHHDGNYLTFTHGRNPTIIPIVRTTSKFAHQSPKHDTVNYSTLQSKPNPTPSLKYISQNGSYYYGHYLPHQSNTYNIREPVYEHQSSSLNHNYSLWNESNNYLKNKLRKLIKFPANSEFTITFQLTIPYGTFLTKSNWRLIGDYRFEVSFQIPDEFPWAHDRGRQRRGTNGVRSLLAQHRFSVYEVFSDFLEKMGYDGDACLQKAVCESVSVPLHEYGLLGDIVALVLAPGYHTDDILYQYVEAEEFGLRNGSCSHQFAKCPMSLYDLVYNGIVAEESIH